MAAERLTQERRRELTRSALLDAAVEVFSQRGFGGASLEEIAETAGFTRGAIYKNFANKEELFFAVYDRGVQSQLDAFKDALGGGSPAANADGMHDAAELWRRILTRDYSWFAFDLEFRLYALRNPDVRERYAAHQRATRALIARFIQEQVTASGTRLKVPADTLAAILDTASLGFLAQAAIEPDDAQLYATFLELIVPAIIDAP